MEAFSLISSPIQPHLARLINNCQSSFVIASPYIKKSAVEWLIESKPSSVTNISVLTNVSLANILSNSLETSALRLIFDNFKSASIVSLPYLHAKVFIADKNMALVTSANFTNGGLWKNYEYGVFIKDEAVVETIAGDISAYMELGGMVSSEFLNAVETKIMELAQDEEDLKTHLATKSLYLKLRKSQTDLQDILLSNRVREGKTINNLFSQTILLILRKHPDGLTTPQIHLKVQGIHPDICDDTIDRVINGQHYGKRWKHYVRRAQEYLQEKGTVIRIDGKWKLHDTK